VDPTVTIRPAESGDVEALGRLGAALVQEHYDFDRQRFLAPGPGTASGYGSYLGGMAQSGDACVFVAVSDGSVAGYVFAALEPLSWMDLRGPAGVVHDVIVSDDARRGGIGTKLMDAAIGWLREHGAPRVILMTAARNAGAQALFHRLGFRDTMVEMTLEL
jgi:ribosomal protein S18 acetylase RimI-like enzyme